MLYKLFAGIDLIALFIQLGTWQKHLGFYAHECGRHKNEFTGHLDVQMLHLVHITQKIFGDLVDGDIVNIQFITPDLKYYIDQKSVPGGTVRNWDSYGHKIAGSTPYSQAILADPQTSGGLLIAAESSATAIIESVLADFNLERQIMPIGRFLAPNDHVVTIL